ncbi:hypothetical protein [Syntrophus aciditrophicus]|uniref:Hypothetical cytosolic protein n=1 Tax=Syntrophus aciditrophicus (strain SB) TaxID=56780 RepID=Q2LYC8_SYNAS|nr:hypothetical protein [Syntrophus aciditrophicus]ABC75919.1 hypothetical cytosolic protein [Syntrophus aciditrophicus SB]
MEDGGTEFGEGLIGSEISAQNPPEIQDSGRSLNNDFKRHLMEIIDVSSSDL